MANFTKKAIREAFVQLLNERPLSQITVKDIVDRCGVNRNTFYYYYQDIPQLIETIVREDVEEILRAHPTIDSTEECLNAALEFAMINRKASLHIYNSVNRDIYEQSQWRVCGYVVELCVDGILAGRKLSDEDRAALVDYLKCVVFGLTIGWLQTGMDPDALDRFRRLFQLKHGDLEQLIERCGPQ